MIKTGSFLNYNEATEYYDILLSVAYVTLYMRDCSHYEMKENKWHLSYGFP